MAVIRREMPRQNPRGSYVERPRRQPDAAIVATTCPEPYIKDNGYDHAPFYGVSKRSDEFFDDAFAIVASCNPVSDNEHFASGLAKYFSDDFPSRPQK